MKLRQVLIIAILLLGWVDSNNTKGYKPAKVYMFGFAASFDDSTVYVTNIQKVDAYLANDRTKFLANREDYSYQLRYYLQDNGLVGYPTCVTMYAENENKAMKQFTALKDKYEKGKKKYIVKFISDAGFSYKTITPDSYTSSEETQVSIKTTKSKQAGPLRMEINNFRIADFDIQVIFRETDVDGMHLLSSFEPFRIKEVSENVFFRLTVDNTLRPVPKERRQRIRVFDTGNGDTIVSRVDDGSYQYIIRDINGSDCCLLRGNKDFSDCRCALNGTKNMRTFGLNNALMFIFAFAGARKKTLLTHASLIRDNGYGYAFIAKSGTGKSTQVSMWLRYIPGSDLMDDDNPIVRIIDGETWTYDSPWSGKTPYYRNVKTRLGAITRIDRATTNSAGKPNPIAAFASLLSSCSSMEWNSDIYNGVYGTITKIVEAGRMFTLHRLPNQEAAEVCYRTVAKR